MSNHIYTYCPHCATPLIDQEVYNHQRRVCPNCQFIQFYDPKVAVIALVTLFGKVLLIQRGVDPAKGKWALPGGYMDAGEMPEDALKRELQEELSLDIQIEKLLDIFPMAGPGVVNKGIVLAYQAAPADAQNIMLKCQDDVVDAGWFTVSDIPNDIAFESTQTLLEVWRNLIGSQTSR